MDEKKLLEELIQAGKKQSGLLRTLVTVNVVLTAGVLLAFALLVPKTLSVVREAQDAVAEVQEVSSAAKESLGGIDQIIEGANTILEDADQMVKDANQIMNDNASDMKEALENFNSVDFDALNKAINNLAEAVKPLVELVKLFG